MENFYSGDFEERWAAYGYDIKAAEERRAAFGKRLWQIKDVDEALAAAWAFEDEEKRIAIAQGVPPDDPDLWMFDASKKHYL